MKNGWKTRLEGQVVVRKPLEADAGGFPTPSTHIQWSKSEKIHVPVENSDDGPLVFDMTES